MKIGLLSDTHGKLDRMQAAIARLIELGAETLVHCGDLGSTDCVRALGGHNIPSYAVAGNTDRHIATLQRVATGAGVEFHWEAVEVPLGDGQSLIAIHGHDKQLMGELLEVQQFRYLCHGHSHHRRDERIGHVRVINPGALSRAHPHSAALLDTEADELTFLDIHS